MNEIRKLEKQNKTLVSDLEKFNAEVGRLREENLVLRDSNVQFQIQLFKLKNQLGQKTSSNTNPGNLQSSTPVQWKIQSIQSLNLDTADLETSKTEQEQDFDYDESGQVTEEIEYALADEDQEEEEEDMEEMESKIETQNLLHVPAPPKELLPYLNSSKATTNLNPKLNQTEIQSQYKIKLGPKKLSVLNETPSGVRNDSRFLSLLLTWIFDKETLLNARATQKRGNSGSNESQPLNKKKVDFMKGLYLNFFESKTIT